MRLFILLVFSLAVPAFRAQSCADVPIVNAGPHECCLYPKPFDEEIFVQCYREFGAFAAVDRNSGKDGDCVAECFFNRTNILVNNQIDMNAALQNVKINYANDPEFHQLFLTASTECVNEGIQRKSQFDQSIENISRNAGVPVCNPISTFIMTCLQTYVLRACPLTRWTPSNDCNALRAYATTCKYSHFT